MALPMPCAEWRDRILLLLLELKVILRMPETLTWRNMNAGTQRLRKAVFNISLVPFRLRRRNCPSANPAAPLSLFPFPSRPLSDSTAHLAHSFLLIAFVLTFSHEYGHLAFFFSLFVFSFFFTPFFQCRKVDSPSYLLHMRLFW